MKFEQSDYDRIWPHIDSDKAIGYKIVINGSTFRSNSTDRRSIFRSKSAAMGSLNYCLSYKVQSIIKEKLKALGMTDDEIKKDAEYIGA